MQSSTAGILLNFCAKIPPHPTAKDRQVKVIPLKSKRVISLSSCTLSPDVWSRLPCPMHQPWPLPSLIYRPHLLSLFVKERPLVYLLTPYYPYCRKDFSFCQTSFHILRLPLPEGYRYLWEESGLRV